MDESFSFTFGSNQATHTLLMAILKTNHADLEELTTIPLLIAILETNDELHTIFHSVGINAEDLIENQDEINEDANHISCSDVMLSASKIALSRGAKMFTIKDIVLTLLDFENCDACMFMRKKGIVLSEIRDRIESRIE